VRLQTLLETLPNRETDHVRGSGEQRAVGPDRDAGVAICGSTNADAQRDDAMATRPPTGETVAALGGRTAGDAPAAGVKPLRWVLYTMERVTDLASAHTVIAWYERRPTIEDYHKALKTGCHVERRYYETAQRLERVTGLLSVVAVRLLQLKTAAKETPDRPALRWLQPSG